MSGYDRLRSPVVWGPTAAGLAINALDWLGRMKDVWELVDGTLGLIPVDPEVLFWLLCLWPFAALLIPAKVWDAASLRWNLWWCRRYITKIDRTRFPAGIDVTWKAANWLPPTPNMRLSLPLRIFNGTSLDIRVDLDTEGHMLFQGHAISNAKLIAPNGVAVIPSGKRAVFTLEQPLTPDDRALLEQHSCPK